MPGDKSYVEKREFERINVSFIVVYRVSSPLEVTMLIGNKEVHAIMSDLSEGGMSILSNYNLPVSTLVNSQFILVNENAISKDGRVKSMQTDGEVRYSIPMRDRTYRLGVKFISLSESDKHFIADFVKETRRAV